MKSLNEWDQLKQVVVGKAIGHRWPTNDDFFNKSIKMSTWDKTTWNPNLPDLLLKEAEEDLEALCEILDKENIVVHRTSYNCYNARDVLFHYDKTYVCPTPFTYRKNEYEKFKSCINSFHLIRRSKNKLFDAANLLKFTDKILYQVSLTGEEGGIEILQELFNVEIIPWRNAYAFAHIDSTLLPLNQNTILLNSDRVSEDNLPSFLKDYKKIWVEDMIERDFYNFPYSSKWIGMNVLSINPETVIVDSIQKPLIKQLKENNFKVIGTPMRHSRTLGGGMHCVTLDIERT